jgi:hypothetical protein
MPNTRASNIITRWQGAGGLNYPSAITAENRYRRNRLDPVNLPIADGILWDPGLTTWECFDVEFIVVNQHTAPIVATVGIDIAGGGALAAGEYWLYNLVIPHTGDSGWQGPFAIAGDDIVRGLCPTIASGGVVHWRIERAW